MFSTPVILFEDNHVIVALKEPNLLTQGDKTGDEDMLSLLKKHVKEKYDKPGEAFLGLVHRMDRPVGGLLVFARTSKAAQRLAKQLGDNRLQREYVLIVEGNPPPSFTLRDFLVKDEATNMVKAVPSYLRKGKEAVLHARKIAQKEEDALVIVRLETGRAHQIRVQMATAGFPLKGDQRYGGKQPRAQIALWGMRLSFAHPITDKQMVFIAPPPMDENKPTEENPRPQPNLWLPYRRELEGLQSVWPPISEQLPLE